MVISLAGQKEPLRNHLKQTIKYYSGFSEQKKSELQCRQEQEKNTENSLNLFFSALGWTALLNI